MMIKHDKITSYCMVRRFKALISSIDGLQNYEFGNEINESDKNYFKSPTSGMFLNVASVFRLPRPYRALTECLLRPWASKGENPPKVSKSHETGTYSALTECFLIAY